MNLFRGAIFVSYCGFGSSSKGCSSFLGNVEWGLLPFGGLSYIDNWLYPRDSLLSIAMCPRIFSWMNSRVNIFTLSVDFSQTMNVRGFSPSCPSIFSNGLLGFHGSFSLGFPNSGFPFPSRGGGVSSVLVSLSLGGLLVASGPLSKAPL